MQSLAGVANALKRASGSRLPALVLMTDEARLPDPLPAMRRLPAGSAVLLRHYGAEDRGALARRLAETARRHGLLLLVGEDPALARAVGAAGVHLPVRALAAAAAVRWRAEWLITAAAHGPAGLRRAAARGVDAAFLSPVFPTASHPGAPCLGPMRFAALARHTPLPVYALGGIDGKNAAQLRNTAAAGLAGITAFAPN